MLKGIKIDTETCKKVSSIQYNGAKFEFKLDISKPMPIRSSQDKQN